MWSAEQRRALASLISSVSLEHGLFEHTIFINDEKLYFLINEDGNNVAYKNMDVLDGCIILTRTNALLERSEVVWDVRR